MEYSYLSIGLELLAMEAHVGKYDWKKKSCHLRLKKLSVLASVSSKLFPVLDWEIQWVMA